MLLVAAAASVLVSSSLIVSFLRVKGPVAVALALYAFAWAQIQLVVQVLSLIGSVTPGFVAAAHACLAVLMGLLWWRAGGPASTRERLHRLRELPASALHRIAETGRAALHGSWLTALLAVCGLCVAGVGLYLAVATPPNDYDSMAYHLSRAAYWRQQHAVQHYPTHFQQQNAMPVVSEVGMLWTMVLTGGDGLVALPQYFALLAVVLGLYGVCRALGQSRKTAAGIALLFSTLPVVIAQAPTTINDLVVTAFLVSTVFFVLKGLSPGRTMRRPVDRRRNLLRAVSGHQRHGVAVPARVGRVVHCDEPPVLASLSQGDDAPLANPGARRPGGYRPVLQPELGPNAGDYGNPLLDPAESARQQVESPGISTLTSNLVRTVASFYDYPWPGRPEVRVLDPGTRVLQGALNAFHAWLGLDLSSPRTTWPGYSYTLPANAPSSVRSYFGPLGFLIVWPSLLALTLLLVAHVAGLRRMQSDAVAAGWLALAAVAFLICYSLLLKWQPWLGRMYMGAVALGLPAAAWIFRVRPTWLRVGVQCVVGAIAVYTTSFALLYNEERPIRPDWQGRSVLSMSAVEVRYVLQSYFREAYDVVNAFVPGDGRLGLSLRAADWDYPFFNDLRRTCIPVVNSTGVPADPAEIIRSNKLDALLARPEFVARDFTASALPPDIRLVRLFQDHFMLFVRHAPETPFAPEPHKPSMPPCVGEPVDRLRSGASEGWPPWLRRIDVIAPVLEYRAQLAGDYLVEACLVEDATGLTRAYSKSRMDSLYPSADRSDNETLVEQLNLQAGVLPAGTYHLQLLARTTDGLHLVGWESARARGPSDILTLPGTIVSTEMPSEQLHWRPALFKTVAGMAPAVWLPDVPPRGNGRGQPVRRPPLARPGVPAGRRARHLRPIVRTIVRTGI